VQAIEAPLRGIASTVKPDLES